MAIPVGELEAILKLKDQLSPSLKVVGQNIDQTGSKIKSLGSSLTALSAVMAGVGGASVVMSAKFEASMTRLVTLAGVSSKEIEGVKKRILELAPAVGIGPQALADAMTKISSTTSDTSVALQILEISAKGSAAGLGEAVDVAGALTAVINSYGSENITAARAADILVQTVKEGGAEAKELAPTLANVVPIAAQLGISFEEVGANIATVTKLGVPTSEAVTQLTSVMVAMIKPSEQGAKALASVGLTYEQLRKNVAESGLSAALADLQQRFAGNVEGLTDVFGRVEALRNIMSVGGAQADTYAQVLQKVSESTGSLETAFKAMEGTTAHTWDQLIAQIGVLAVKLGDELAPTLQEIVHAGMPLLLWAAEAIKWFGALPEPVKTFAIALGLVAAAAGPMLFALGGITQGVGAFIQVMGLCAPGITKLIGGIGGLGGAIGPLMITLGKLLMLLGQVAAAFAAGWAIGTIIRDATGLGAKLDELADASANLAIQEARATSARVQAMQPEIKARQAASLAAGAAAKAAADGAKKTADAEKAAAAAAQASAAARTAAAQKAAEEVKQAAEQEAQAIKDMVAEYSGAKVASEAKVFNAALAQLNVENIPTEQLEQLAEQAVKLGDAGQEIEKLGAIFQELGNRAQAAMAAMDLPAFEEGLKDVGTALLEMQTLSMIGGATPGAPDAGINQAAAQAAADYEKLRQVLDGVKKDMGLINGEQMRLLSLLDKQRGNIGEEAYAKAKEEILGASKATFDWAQALENVANQAQSMEGIFGSLLTQILSGVAGIGAAFQSLQKLGGGKGFLGLGGLGESMKTFAGKMAVGQAVGQGLGALSGMLGGANTTAGRAAGGAAMGAQIGAIAGPWGMAAGAVVGAIVGAFKKPSWVKVGKEAGKVLGTEISNELAKQIEKTSKDLGVSVQTAALLNLGDAMAESGKSATTFGDEMSTLLKGIADGSVPAQQGIKELGEAFSMLAQEAEAGSTVAMAQMGVLAAQSRALGQDIPEITAAVEAAVQQSVDALPALGGIKIVDAEDAKAQAQIFLSVFNGVLATEGIVAAAQAMQPALKSFQEQLSKAGISKGAADAILGPIHSAMSLLKNDMTKGGAEGAQALKEILEGQLKAGFLDTGTFTAIQQQAKTAFDQMIKGGADTNAALQAVAPLLAQMQETAAATGQALDPVTQQMIEQAKAAGIAFPVDTGTQMVDLLKELVTVMGGQLPASVTQAASAMSTLAPTAASASASASSSLLSIADSAAASTTQIIGEFQTIGGQIAGTVAPAADQIASQIGIAFDAAGDDAMEFLSKLQMIDGTRINIPFDFQGGGGDGIPAYQHGGYVPETPGGTIVRVAERGTGGEDITPRKGKGSGGRGGTIIVNVTPSSHQSPHEIGREVIRQISRNGGGIQSEMDEGYS